VLENGRANPIRFTTTDYEGRTLMFLWPVFLSFCWTTTKYPVVNAFGVYRQQIRMVEGHSVHRVAAFHRRTLIGKKFSATSPNGRFTDGAKAIHGKTFSRIEAVGKNLFAFFGGTSEASTVVVHVHFGMAGAWAVYQDTPAPEPTKTNRLRLECPGIVADLSAMTVKYGGMDMYNDKRSKLGEDPLRKDANPENLWERIQKSKKSIGFLLMDQSFFAGPGNIYRAEILFKAGIHPEKIGVELQREEFDRVWFHTVALLQRGFELGSIITVDPEEAVALGNPRLRRYIYNSSRCPRCNSSIKSWMLNSRTCYACPICQPMDSTKSAIVTPVKNHVPFNSHCAYETMEKRLSETGPTRLTVVEIKRELSRLGVAFSSKAKKAELVNLLDEARNSNVIPVVSPEEAALEKAYAGESLAVEHIAELSSDQARMARSRASRRLFPDSTDSKRTQSATSNKRRKTKS
jgi:formamidopyrimidine-DNA glycosylase